MVTGWTRRGLLGATAGIGSVGLAGAVGGQGRITTRMVGLDAGDFVQDDYAGYFLHVGDPTESDLDPGNFGDCEFETWPPDAFTTFQAQPIDRIEEQHREQETEVWVPADADVERGTLWVIDATVPCPSGYVGFTVERIGSGFVVEETGDDAAAASPDDDGNGGVPQPGFGPGAAIAALLAGGYALVRRSSDE